MAKAADVVRTGGMAALILAWVVGGEVKLGAIVLLGLFVAHHAVALAVGFVAYALIELAFCPACAGRSTSGAVDASWVTSPAGSRAAMGSSTASPH